MRYTSKARLDVKQSPKSHIIFVAGPPGTNYAVMKKAFEEGWGGVIAKTVSVDSSKVPKNLNPFCSNTAKLVPVFA